jgi:hypothetical protein
VADDVRGRVDSFTSRARTSGPRFVAFTSKDDNLSKAHVRYLEARLLQLASVADRVKIENGTSPPLPRLSEPDRADMEGFIEEMLVVLPLLGVVAFEPLERQAKPVDLLALNGKDAKATGADTPDGFVVYEGSLARAATVPSLPPSTVNVRQGLLNDGVLVPDGLHLRFSRPHAFDSPSTAAAVVLGRTANGRVEWKDQIGQTLRQRQQSALADSDALGGD